MLVPMSPAEPVGDLAPVQDGPSQNPGGDAWACLREPSPPLAEGLRIEPVEDDGEAYVPV